MLSMQRPIFGHLLPGKLVPRLPAAAETHSKENLMGYSKRGQHRTTPEAPRGSLVRRGMVSIVVSGIAALASAGVTPMLPASAAETWRPYAGSDISTLTAAWTADCATAPWMDRSKTPEQRADALLSVICRMAGQHQVPFSMWSKKQT